MKHLLLLPVLLLIACGPDATPVPATRQPEAAAAADRKASPAAAPAKETGPPRRPTAPLPGVNLALGRAYTMSETPNYKLCADPDDVRQLTDGVHAQGWFWTDMATVGWNSKKRIVVSIDLGSVQPIGTIAFETAGNRTFGAKAGVDLPDAWFLVSEDGVAYHRVASFHGLTMPDLPDTYIRRFQADGLGVAARHVAVVIIPNTAFAFCDEIEVLRGTEAAPPSGPAYTLDRIFELQGRDRASAALQATVGANLAACGGTNGSLAGRPDADWRQANAWLAAARFPGQKLIAWRRDIWQDYAVAELPPVGAEAPASLDLVMGQDEYESGGFALTNASPGPIRIQAAITDLLGPDGRIPAATATLRIDAFSDALDGRQHPDALPLLDGDGAVIEPGCTRQVWLTVRAEGQPAGTYRGSLALTWPGGSREVPVAIEVLGVALPSPLPLSTAAWSYLNFAPVKADTDAAIRDLAAHRITTTVLHPESLPSFAVAADGTVSTADFTTFDRTVRRFQAVGIRQFIFFNYFGDGGGLKSPLGCRTPVPAGMQAGDPAWKQAMTAIIRSWTAHCLELGLGYNDFAFYPFDEPSDALIRLGQPVYAAIRAADPKARVFMTVVHESTPPVLATVAGSVDVWCHHLNRNRAGLTPIPADKQAFYAARQQAGSGLWLYNAQEPDKSFPPLGHYRQLFWRAWAAGAVGAGVWNYADTGHGKFTSAWTDLDGTREDFSLVYDAATAPEGISRREAQIPSRRWEAFRDGIEDYAYLWQLRQAAIQARAAGRPLMEAETVLTEVAAAVAADPLARTTYDTCHQRILRALAAIRNSQ